MESSAELLFQAITSSGKRYEKWIDMLKVKKIRKEQVIRRLDLLRRRQARKKTICTVLVVILSLLAPLPRRPRACWTVSRSVYFTFSIV